jgi:hypothetical protein
VTREREFERRKSKEREKVEKLRKRRISGPLGLGF